MDCKVILLLIVPAPILEELYAHQCAVLLLLLPGIE